MSLKIMGFNGSARSNYSTAQLVQRALEGASSQGAETEYVELGKLNFKPCRGCLACKQNRPGSAGVCHYKDELSPYLEKIRKCDGLIVGFPIYIGMPSGLAHGFLERAWYSQAIYRSPESAFGRKIKTGMIVTMGAPKEAADTAYKPIIEMMNGVFTSIYGSCEYMTACSTVPVKNFSKYRLATAKVEELLDFAKKQFPKDLDAAYELGKRIATK